jgi:hypothetical protein
MCVLQHAALRHAAVHIHGQHAVWRMMDISTGRIRPESEPSQIRFCDVTNAKSECTCDGQSVLLVADYYFGKSRAGLWSKKFTGFNSNSCHAVGITGQSSACGT